jgi:glycosyltransferase involved in cell wall biosynthesis
MRLSYRILVLKKRKVRMKTQSPESIERGSNSLSILFVAPQPFYEDRGSPIVILEELKVLSDMGFLVDLVTYPVGREIDLPGVRVVRTSNPMGLKHVSVGLSFRKIFLNLFLLFKAFSLAVKKNYVCVHGVEEGAGIALLCKALFGIPTIYDMHSSLPEQLKVFRFFRIGPAQKLALSFENMLVRRADVIVASRGLARQVLSIEPEKAIWEFHFEGVAAPCERDEDLARNLGVQKRPTVLYMGTFAPYQGLKLLLQAAELLRTRIPEVALLLIGGTTPELFLYDRLLRRHGLTDTVLLHPRVNRREVAEYLMLADVLVLPRPRGENAPLKIFDYIGTRKPIVATDIPAHNIMLSNKTATLVEPEASALADGLASALRESRPTRRISSADELTCQAERNMPLKEAVNQAYNYLIGLESREERSWMST